MTRIINFLEKIGLQVRIGVTPETTVLPGIAIDGGVLLIDPSKLEHEGDLLHEAGHLAVLPKAERCVTGSDAEFDGGSEMAAIAWSFAASVHLQLNPRVVFHPKGYRGGSQAILENFEPEGYIGEGTSASPFSSGWA